MHSLHFVGFALRLFFFFFKIFYLQGCGTGLSMYMAQSAWPSANLLGVDMSTYKLAISAAKLEKKPKSVRSKVTIVNSKVSLACSGLGWATLAWLRLRTKCLCVTLLARH